MEPLLILALYILAAIGLGWLANWGMTKAGWGGTPAMVVGGIIFILVLLYGLSRTGVLSGL